MKKTEEHTENVYPKFLDNKPCGEDLFESKSHEQIALQIANLLQGNTSIHAIGIDGGWGSGKSNLVELIKNNLDKQKYHFLIYDAWGYQTDFQRRSILENITSDLIDNQLIARNKWNGRLLQLLSRKRTIGTKVMRGLNPVAKVGGMLALFSPVLIPLVNMISINWLKWMFWVLISLVAIALIVYLQIRDMKKYGQTITCTNFFHELFVSYLDYTSEKSDSHENIEESIKYETIYDEEPSTRDFRLWMQDVDNELDKHKLILVIDNMDRLQKVKVQELWSAINTLFAEQDYKNITVIVPFDREHIKFAFQSEDSGQEKCYGDDFINKTFSVVYRVAPPILSDWKKYFTIMWQKAFGEDAIIEENITQIYDLLANNKTPRDITAFINKFVSLKQIAEDKIPDKYIALYICGECQINEKPFDEIIKPTYLGSLEFLYRNDEQLPKYIAALYYQIDPEKAIEVAYLDRLSKALNTGNEEEIKVISTLPTFESLLENAITTVSNVSNAVNALNSCGVAIAKRFWNSLCNKVNRQEEHLQEYQIILINKIDRSSANKYTRKIVNEFYSANPFDAVSYHQSIKRLVENKTTDPLQFIKQKTITPQAFVEYVKKVEEDYADYNIVCDGNELDEYLGNLEVSELQNLSIIPFIHKDYLHLEKYQQHLEDLIDTNVADLSVVSLCYNLLKQIASGELMTKMLSPQQIYSLYNNCSDDNDFRYDLAAMRLAKYEALNTSCKIINLINSPDEIVVNKVANVIEYYTTYNDILIHAHKLPQQKLLKEVAIYLTQSRKRNSRLNILEVLQQYQTIKDYLSIDAEVIISRFNDWNPEKITVDKVSSIPLQFFKDVAQRNINNKLANHCITRYVENLIIISTEAWIAHIETEDREYQMLQYIGKNKIQTCFDAFKKLLVDKATGDSNILNKEKCDYLLRLAREKGYPLKAAFNNVRDKFYNGTTMTNDKFQYFGELLLEYATLTDKNSSTLRTIFPNELFDIEANVTLIIKYKEIMLSIYEKATDDEKADFRNKIQTLIDGKYKKNENAPDGFEQFAGLIGVSRTSILEKILDTISGN